MKSTNQVINIFPRNLENIKSILLHYFPTRPHSEIEEFAFKLYDEREFQLDEIIEVAQMVRDNVDYLLTHLRADRLTVAVSFGYGADAVLEGREIKGSENGKLITAGLKERISNKRI